MNVLIGSDHRGYSLKKTIISVCQQSAPGRDINWIDVGCDTHTYCDYPFSAKDVVDAMRQGQAQFGVLVCGTGVGMSIVANRFQGIYAALVWTSELARLAREHDNANILVLPADCVTPELSCQMIQGWLTAVFEGGRHLKRIQEIDAYKGA